MLDIRRIGWDDATAMLHGAAARARQIGVPMCIAVVDEAGHLVAFQRMDGAKVLSVTLAEDKAMTAAMARRPTHEYNAAAVPGSLTYGIQSALGGRFSTVGGGYPVVEGGVVVGGIGCSSGTPEQDMECARAGMAALAAPRPA